MSRYIPKITLLTVCLSIFLLVKTNSGGPGAGYTNAPSESNCAASGCHSGGLVTSGSGFNRLALRMALTGNGYIPDSTYDFVLHHKETGMSASGFQITCLDEATGKSAGTFSNPDSRTQSMTRAFGSDTRSYLGHAGSSTSSGDSSSYRVRWKAPNKNLGNVRFYVNFNKANSNSSPSGDVIYAKTWSIAPSTLLPTAKVKILDSAYCTGMNLTFDAALTNSPTSYAWTFTNGTTTQTSTLKNPKVSLTQGSWKAILTVKNNKGLSKPDTLSFSVITGIALPVLNATGTKEICKSDTFVLGVVSPSAGNNYIWNTGAKVSNIKVFDTGSFFVTAVSKTNKCSRVSAVTKVAVNPVPSVLILKSFSGDSICANVPFTMGSLVTSGTVDSFSFVSKTGPFSKADTLRQTLSSGPASYSVWGKTTKGCVSKPSSAQVKVKINDAGPTLSASNISYTGFRINWTAVTGALSYRISLDSGKTFITPSSGNTGLSHDVTGLLGNKSIKVQVFANTSGICAKTEIAELVATTLSCTPIDYSVTVTDPRVCKNAFAAVQLNNLTGKTIGVLVDNNYVGKSTNLSIKVDATRDYTISVIDSNALICGYTNKTITLVEDTVSSPVFTPAAPAKFCSDIAIGATFEVLSSHYDSIYWYQNGVLQSRTKGLTKGFVVSNGDSLQAMSVLTSGCNSPKSAAKQVVVNKPGNTGFAVSNNQFLFTFTPNDITSSHKWKIGKDQNTISDSSSNDTAQFDLSAFKNDSVFVLHTVTTKEGCVSSLKRKVFVPDFNSTVTNTIPGLKVYPNPASTTFTVWLPLSFAHAEIEILNINGATVMKQQITKGSNTILIGNMPSGIYQYKLKADGKETTGSLVIEN